ncbi:shufflon protein C, partial [Escherichia coli]|nr:shufflon protein C [Escherichia coli]
MSEPEVFHVPDWHWPTCQSGTWGAPKIQFTTQTYN